MTWTVLWVWFDSLYCNGFGGQKSRVSISGLQSKNVSFLQRLLGRVCSCCSQLLAAASTVRLVATLLQSPRATCSLVSFHFIFLVPPPHVSELSLPFTHENPCAPIKVSLVNPGESLQCKSPHLMRYVKVTKASGIRTWPPVF